MEIIPAWLIDQLLKEEKIKKQQYSQQVLYLPLYEDEFYKEKSEQSEEETTIYISI